MFPEASAPAGAPVSAPSAPSSSPSAPVGSDLYASLDAAFDGQPDAPEPEPQEEESPVIEDDPQPEPDEAPFDDEDADPDEEVTDQAGRKSHNVKPEKMRRLVAAKNYFKAVQDFAPTVEDAKSNYENSADFRAMQVNFSHGEPEFMDKFLDYWGTAGTPGAPLADSFQTMTQSLPNYLAARAARGDQVAGKALSGIESQVRNADISRAYSNAQQLARNGNEQGAADALYRAQSLDYANSGKYRFKTVQEIPQRMQQQPQDQLARDQKAHEQQVTQFADQRWQEFDKSAVTGPRDSAVGQEIDKAFDVVKNAYPPAVLKALKAEANSQLKEALSKQYEWHRNQDLEMKDIQRDFLKSVRSGSKTELEPRAQALVSGYRARAARILPGIVKSMIAEASRNQITQNQATHNRAAAGAGRVAPSPGGRPVRQNITPMQPRQSVNDRLDQLLS
jgi:hypothetical protein